MGDSHVPYRVVVKTVLQWSSENRRFRVGRICWANSKGPGRPGGYSAKLSISLHRQLFRLRRYEGDCELTLFGVRMHYLKDYDRWLD